MTPSHDPAIEFCLAAFATEVRVGHLHDADAIAHGVSSAAVRSPILSRTPGNGSRPKRTVINFKIEGGVIGGAVDVSALGEWGDDQRRNARRWTPAIAPARTRRRRHGDPKSRRSHRR